jgi:hypothetical protein
MPSGSFLSEHLPEPSTGAIALLALGSARQFLSLAAHGSLRRPPDRLEQAYWVDDGGVYQVFRETVSDAAPAQLPNVLVVGFQLKVLAAHRLPHWIFQRCCLLTTPFWSGLPGMAVKLWMVDPETKRYLGIYDWRGTENAQRYVDALVRVLAPLSTADSVWYRLLPDRTLGSYLAEHAAVTPGSKRRPLVGAERPEPGRSA